MPTKKIPISFNEFQKMSNLQKYELLNDLAESIGQISIYYCLKHYKSKK